MTTLIAGIGNIFNRDDGFGSEVAQRLLARRCPTTSASRTTASAACTSPSTCSTAATCSCSSTRWPATTRRAPCAVLEPDPTGPTPAPLDAHLMDPQAVLRMVAELGGTIGRVLVVGCQPADLGEGIGLSPPVAAAVAPAVRMVEDLIAERKAPCSVA